MASTSTLSVQKSFKYDVFLSFRGEDTRKTLAEHLYQALEHTGITTYKDDERIEKGKKIGDQLFKSIEDSRFHVIIFSKNYASSSWCLEELAKIMECQKTGEHTAFPIFYDVEPTEVRKQIGAVGEALFRHETSLQATTWINALREAAGLAGWDMANASDGHGSQFIQKVVQDIQMKLRHTNFIVDENLVGMETRLQNVISSIESGSDDDDVCMVGIRGMGGAGKTTLARALFYKMSFLYEGVSFVEKVRVRSKSCSLNELQKEILSDVVYDKKIIVENDTDGKNMMRMRMPSTKALVVLDDVDDVEQLEVLAGKHSWFKPGSVVIITTRDEHVLVSHGKNFRVNFTHNLDLSLLSDEEATCLFSRYAFGRDSPDQGYIELTKEVIHYAAGIPLTIRVLGSLLCGRTKHEWEDYIERLKRFPEEKTLKILELSYSSLDVNEKEIFLDIACILKGEHKDVAIRILESCGFSAISGLAVLEGKSLITFSDDGHLLLHDRIEEMGKSVVCRDYHGNPRRHSRLWNKEEIEYILQDDLGTEDTRCIKLVNTSLNPAIIINGVKNMKTLRFFHVDHENKTVECMSVSGYNNVGLPNALRYLYWRNYPFQHLPKTFIGNMLVNLEMVGSNISQLWEGGEIKVLQMLKFLNLKNSHLRIFDLRIAPCLETLNLSECKEFVKLYMPVKHLKLKSLNVVGSKVSNLNFEMTPNLEKLCVPMKEFRHLPDSICKLKLLKTLRLESCWLLEQLPEDLGQLRCLEKLSLTECTRLQYLPSSICKMKRLKSLHLPYVGVKNLPAELGNITCLKELNLEGATISDIPRSVREKKGLLITGDRELLKSYGFTSFTKITECTASSYV